jgi:hypothetical protein
MWKLFWAIVFVAWVIAAPIGFILAANIFRLGLQEGFELYGETFTLISALGLLPVLLGIASLFDKAQRVSQEGRKAL